jgi:hypothetical protein
LDKSLAVDIRHAIAFLIKEGETSYPYEREVRLFELLTWFLFPNRAVRMRRAAIRLAGTKFLERIERACIRRGKVHTEGPAEHAMILLAHPAYTNLYNGSVGRHGGWTQLAQEMTIKQFNNKLSARAKDISLIAELVDYRLRYLDHEAGKGRPANITHALVFVWHYHRDNPPVVQRKKLVKQWVMYKKSAAFLYVMERWEPQLCLGVKLGERGFASYLKEQANNFGTLTRFFGMCAYVAERLAESSRKATLVRCFPSADVLPRVKPESKPLPPEELAKFLQEYPGPHGLYEKFQAT